MNKIVPFIFPLIALLIVIGLLVRWYSLRTANEGQITPQAENIEISDISSEDQTRLLQPVQDLKSVVLQPEATTSAQVAQGRLRYETVDDKLNFSLTANLPPLSSGVYQVWLRSQGNVTKGKVLEAEKGGWMTSGTISSQHLPLEILVTRELTDDTQMEEVVLTGQIQAE